MQVVVGGGRNGASASASEGESGRVRWERIRCGVLVLAGGGGARGGVVFGRGGAPLRFVDSLVGLRGG